MSARYQEFEPSPRLKPFIECFWMAMSSRTLTDYPVLPDGCVDIVYSPQIARDLQLVGTMTRARNFALAADEPQFGVRFRAGMSRLFVPLPGPGTTDRLIGLSDIWGAEGGRLRERVGEAKSARQFVEIIEGSLRHPGEIGLAQSLCTWLVSQAGRVRMDDLAFQAGLSTRQLRRLFIEEVGLSPKHFCRILRFRNCISRIPHSGRTNWAEVALECGYYDQAHFINEFRTLSGYTPAEFGSLDR